MCFKGKKWKMDWKVNFHLGNKSRDYSSWKQMSVKEPVSKSKWSNQLRGFILGFSNSNFFFAYGVCYYYGTTLIRNSCPDELQIMEVSVMIGVESYS